MKGGPLELSGSYLVQENKNGWATIGEGRVMIDSVVWPQHINVTDRQPRRHSKCRANVLRRAAKAVSKPSRPGFFATPVNRHTDSAFDR